MIIAMSAQTAPTTMRKCMAFIFPVIVHAYPRDAIEL